MTYFNEIVTIGGIVAAIVGAGGFWQTMRWFAERRDKKKETSLVKGIESLHRVYSAIAGIQEIGAHRVILWAGHNSGGIPRPNSPFYASALHWAIDRKFQGRMGDYQNLQVDLDYITMLLALQREGHVRVYPAKMTTCMLKDCYAAEGVSDSVLLFLGVVENKFLYLSAAKYEGEFSDLDIVRIRMKSQVIANEIRGVKGL